jgi:transposase
MARQDHPLYADMMTMRKAGATYEVIADEFDVAVATVASILSEGNPTPALSKKPISDELVQRIGADYAGGMTFVALTQKYGVSTSVIYQAINELGLETRGSRNKAVEEAKFAEALDMYQRRETLAAIEKATGFSAQRFYRWLRRHNGEVRNARS